MSAQVHQITPRGHRTPEQIREQLEARMAELEREAASAKVAKPCDTCRWKTDGFKCQQPLIIGFDVKSLPNVQWQLAALTHEGGKLSDNWPSVRLCGLEKALWEPKPEARPKPPYLQRFMEWLARIIERIEGNTHGKGDK